MRSFIFAPLALCLYISAVRAETPKAVSSGSTGIAESSKTEAPIRATSQMKVEAHDESEHETRRATGPLGRGENNADYFWRRADEEFHNGNYERAIALHKAIVALDPHDSQSFGVAAWLMWSLGRGEEATAHLRRGVAGDPKNWEMWNELAENFDLQKQPRDAQDAYGHAVALLPKEEDSQMIRRRLAHAAQKAGDLQTSIATWRALTKDFPNDVVNKNNLARVEGLEKAATEAARSGKNEAAQMLLAGTGLLGALFVSALARR